MCQLTGQGAHRRLCLSQNALNLQWAPQLREKSPFPADHSQRHPKSSAAAPISHCLLGPQAGDVESSLDIDDPPSHSGEEGTMAGQGALVLGSPVTNRDHS